jgi:cytochrome oxidase Cu insertion factor (SCO1/SenC/PrrC family)
MSGRRLAMALCTACLLAAIGLGGLALVGRSAAAPVSTGKTWFTGTHWQPQAKILAAPNFTLPDQERHLMSLSQFRGRVVLLTFTSSVCKQQCPLVGRALTAAERMLGSLSRRTVLLNVSVEPETDTHKTVFQFAREVGWGAYDWHYLWTARQKMKPIWRAYYVYVQTPPPTHAPGLDVQHLAALALIDGSGRIRGYFSYPFLPAEIARGARDLLQGRA